MGLNCSMSFPSLPFKSRMNLDNSPTPKIHTDQVFAFSFVMSVNCELDGILTHLGNGYIYWGLHWLLHLGRGDLQILGNAILCLGSWTVYMEKENWAEACIYCSPLTSDLVWPDASLFWSLNFPSIISDILKS